MIVHFVKMCMVGLRDDNNCKTSVVMDQVPKQSSPDKSSPDKVLLSKVVPLK